MQRLGFFLWATIAFALAACGKPAFTDTVRARYGLNEQDIGRMQLYTSDEIVLRRELIEQEKTLSGNALAIRDGVKVEEVIIPARTAGVAIRVEGEHLLVSFSRERPDYALWFGIKKRDRDNALEESRYELMPFVDKSAQAEGAPSYAKGFLVTYGSRKYHVVDGNMWNVHLLYDLDESFANDVTRNKAPGWRLSEGLPTATQAPTIETSQEASEEE